MPSQAKISLFSKKLSSLTDTQNENEDTMVAAVVGIQLILEEVLMEEDHHNGRLFDAACLLRQCGS
jgi:hypothetical protein